MRVFSLLFALLMSTPAWADRDKLFWSSDWPAGVPNPTKWSLSQQISLVDGSFVELTNATVIFEVHAQPERPVLWQVSRFIICYKGEPCGPETVVWLKPTARAQVFYRFERRRNWKHLWLGHELYWYRLPDGSPEYETELTSVRKIFYLVPQLRDHELKDGHSLTF